jgi:predicted glycosyltransferase
LYRAVRIAQAMAAAGLDVDLVSGGMPVPGQDTGGVRLHQLAPIKCRDGDFSVLIDQHDRPLDDSLREHRLGALLSLFQERQPAAIFIEAFPFGRRQMRFELLPFLEEARSRSPKPVIICSVRDILQISDKSDRVRETVDLVNSLFDHVLVHGDPAFAALEETFPGASDIAGKIHYTGMVADLARPARASDHQADGEILVSAGGGATQSEILLGAALAARPLSPSKDRLWRLLAGPNLTEGEFAKLAAAVPAGVTLEPNRDDFASLLAGCAVSVSQAGYNTVVDLLQCGCRSVVVPYSARGETEQSFRARRLRERGLAQVVEETALSPESLAVAIDAALAAPPPSPAGIDLGGAEKSAELVSGWLDG